MINVSNEFKQTMQTRTDFKEYAEITLVDGTVINLDDTQFTVTNNSVTDGAALSSVPIGVAVQKIAQLEVLNDQEQWGNYDFFGAKIRLYMTFALSNSTEKVERGLYTVTTPETYGETVIITAYDDMYKADKNYSTTLSFPNTLKNMLIDICQTCFIPLLSTTFPHDDFTIPTKPDGQYTYRQIISYIAMLAGGNARINNAGYLEIITYSEIASNSYYGNLTGIEAGAPEHVLSSWQSLTMDKNDITVTGVALKIDTQNGQESHLAGADGYVITVYNPLVNASDETTLATAMHNISEHLVGLTFRKFYGISVSNPLIEFMDFVAVKDRRGRLYQSFVTDITFTFLGSSTIKNSAESAVRTETVYAGNVNTEIRMRKLVEAERSARELAVSNLSKALANSSGLYETAATQPDGSTIYYLHDKPTLAESKSVIKLTAEAIGLSTDGGKTYPYGFTITGEMVTRLLAAEGINADWIKTGALTISDETGNEIFNADLDKKTVNMASTRVTIDGKTFNSRIAESVTDFRISPLNQLSGSRNLKDDRYYLVSDIYALAGSMVLGQRVLRATPAIADWPEITVPDGSTDSALRLVDCVGASYRLTGISIESGKTYTFSVHLRADSATTVQLSILGNASQTVSVGTEWSTITVTCVAQASVILISPVDAGALYFYQAMLQEGEIPTAWTPNTEEDTEKVTELTKKYSELQQDVNGFRTEVGDQISGAKSYTDQKFNAITLQLVDSTGAVVSQIKMEDSTIKLTGDVLADTLTVAKLFARDITVSGSFAIDNGDYYIGTNSASLSPDGTEVSYGLAMHTKKGGDETFLGFSDNGIELYSSNKNVAISTSNGLWLNGAYWDSGIWTPALNNVATYTRRKGTYAKLGNSTVVSFLLRGTFDENTGSPLTIYGCPVSPGSDYAASGGGSLTGYHAGDNVVFSGWKMSADGDIVATGQWATGKENARYIADIYPRSGADFELSGTIAF